MGGTFDPPHIGHLAMAEAVYEKLNLEKVWFIPTGKIQYKDSSETASPQERLVMTELAVRGNPKFTVEPIEAESGRNSYTSETLEKLTLLHPDCAFTFIVGADSLDYMERWREPEKIFRLCTVAAVNRIGYSMEKIGKKIHDLEQRFDAKIHIVSMPLIAVSSTEIRERFRNGGSVRYLVRDEVLNYMNENQIYHKSSHKIHERKEEFHL